MCDVQYIGFDCGRGYVKAYSEVGEVKKEVLFKSVIGDGRNIEFSDYMGDGKEEPRYISFDNERYFAGLLAEKESQTPIRNSMDSKTSETVKVLLAAVLSEIAVKDKIKLMIGVPYKSYKKSVLAEVKETYEGKTFEVKNELDGKISRVTIDAVTICREGDAALFHAIGGKINEDKPVGIASVGFRTTELSYFDKGFVFNDKRSTTIEFGNRTLLSRVQDGLISDGIMKELNEIDTSNDYDEQKKKAYKFGSENLAQRIEDIWINKKEMKLYAAGGTALNLNFNEEFEVLKDAQMATAKGLFEIAKVRL